MKQKLEGIFSKSLKNREDLWYIKLQVNVLAHTTSPADYIILSNSGGKYLVECKQVDLRKNNKSRYTFDRLTQENDLIMFDNRFGGSFICILFLEKFIKKSYFYLIPIKSYILYKDTINKKSVSLKDMENYFQTYRLNVDSGGIINLFPWIK